MKRKRQYQTIEVREQSMPLPRGRVARLLFPSDLNSTDLDFIEKQLPLLRMAIEYKVEYDFSHIDEIAQSEWTGDYFLDVDDAINGQFHISDFAPDRDLYDAITELVAAWPFEYRDEGGTRIYKRPSV